MAISAVARPYCTKGSIFLTSFGAIHSVGSKPFTSPEMRVAKADASKCVIGPIPERPLTMPSQLAARPLPTGDRMPRRSEEHTSELQSLMRSSYAVFCLKNKNTHKNRENKSTYG